MKGTLFWGVPALAAAIILTACGGGDDPATPTSSGDRPTASADAAAPMSEGTEIPNILELVRAEQDFSTLVSLIEAAGLSDQLAAGGPVTLFAPTNDAFSALPAGTVELLSEPENRGQLRNILRYHLVSGQISAASLEGQRQNVTTVAGPGITVDGTTPVLTIGDAVVTRTDLTASNGLIHVIDAMLLPPEG